MQHCSFSLASSQDYPLGHYESVEVDMTDGELYQLIEDEREGRITFEQIKQKYTRRE